MIYTDRLSETELFLRHPFFYNLTVKRMLKMIRNPTEKFIFCFVYLMDFKQKDAAEALNVHETNVSRHMQRIKKRLWVFDPKKKNKDCKEKKIDGE